MRAMTPEDLGDLLRSDEDQQERERLENRAKQIKKAIADVEQQHVQLALAISAKAIAINAAARANEILEEQKDSLENELHELELRRASLPSLEERYAMIDGLRELPPLLYDGGLATVRRILVEAGVRVWCHDREVVKMEIGVID